MRDCWGPDLMHCHWQLVCPAVWVVGVQREVVWQVEWVGETGAGWVKGWVEVQGVVRVVKVVGWVKGWEVGLGMGWGVVKGLVEVKDWVEGWEAALEVVREVD